MKRPPEFDGNSPLVGALNSISAWCWKQRILPGPQVDHTGDGIMIRGGGTGGTNAYPLQLVQRSATTIGVVPGAVTSSNMDGYTGVPEMDGDLLTLLPELSPTDDATTSYYIKLTTVDLDVTEVEIINETPGSAVDNGTIFWLLLGEVIMADGAITAVYAYRQSSLIFQKCASGAGQWGPA